MKTKLHLIGLFLLSMTVSGCFTNNKPKQFDYGHVENHKYTNSFFDFEMTLPADWIVQSKEQTENLTKLGKELVAGDDQNMKALLDASDINTANLLTVFKYEVGSAVEYNANLALVAENLKNAPGIKTGGDYLFQSRKLLKQSQIQYDYIDEEFKKEVINNQEYYLMNASITYMGLTIKQKYYTRVTDGFCFAAIISYVDDEQKEELENILNSMSFKG